METGNQDDKDNDNGIEEKYKSAFIKILNRNKNCFLINEDITFEENYSFLNRIYIQDEDEEKDFPDFEDNINKENILNFDFKKYLEPVKKKETSNSLNLNFLKDSDKEELKLKNETLLKKKTMNINKDESDNEMKIKEKNETKKELLEKFFIFFFKFLIFYFF